MSNITQFFQTGEKKNRTIFVGPLSTTWTVPVGVTEIEVHCWGGGGNGSNYASSPGLPVYSSGSGGGGGGYVTHRYPVTAGDKLQITVGNIGGTSSVTCPTQSPTSPISATGGSNGTTILNPLSTPSLWTVPGGAGGTGSFSIAPGISTASTFAASGGAGGIGIGATTTTYLGGGGGGAAGHITGSGGSGGNGGTSLFPAMIRGASGGGVSSPGLTESSPTGNVPIAGGAAYGTELFQPSTSTVGLGSINTLSYYEYIGIVTTTSSNASWFYVPEIRGIDGNGAGSGSPTTYSPIPGQKSPAPFLGGGASAGAYPGPVPGATTYGLRSAGGIAGGGSGGSVISPATGSGTSGGVGCVIIYW